MLSLRMLRTILPTVPRVSLRGPWYRAVNHDLLTGPPAGSPVQPLWAGGAARAGARFTPRAGRASVPGSGTPAIDCLYLAEDVLTPVLEVAGALAPGASPRLRFEPLVIMTVDGALSDVIDLTDAATQSAIGTTNQELIAPWLLQQSAYLAGRGPLPPTQALGQEAFGSGDIVGLRYPSAKKPDGVGLVVFTSRLVPHHHSLAVFNQRTGRLQQSLP